MAKIITGGDVDKTKLKNEGKYPVFSNSLKHDGLIGYYSDSYKIKYPAVTVTGCGDIGHTKARKINFTPVVRLLVIKSDHDIDFLENIIKIGML